MWRDSPLQIASQQGHGNTLLGTARQGDLLESSVLAVHPKKRFLVTFCLEASDTVDA